MAWIAAVLFFVAFLLTYWRFYHLRKEYRKNAAQLAQWKAKSELVLQCMAEGMYGLDLEGRVTFINAAGLRMLRWEREDLMGTRIDDLIRPPAQEEASQKKGKARINDHFGVEVSDELFMRRDGTLFPVAYTVSPLIVDYNIIGALVIFRDDTERKRQEQELQDYVEKLKKMDSLLSAQTH